MKNNFSSHTIYPRQVFRLMLTLVIITALVITAQPAAVSSARQVKTVFRTKNKIKKLKKTKVTPHSVRLQWRKMRGASGYQVYRGTASKGRFRRIAAVRKNKCTDKTLSSGATYFYKVRAYQTHKKRKKYSRFSRVLIVKLPTDGTETGTQSTTPPVLSTPVPPQAAATSSPKPSAAAATGTPGYSEAPGSSEQPPSVSGSPSPTPAATDIPPSAPPAATLTPHVQNLDYRESTERINNPDQGFYRPIYVRVKEDGVTYNKNIINDSTQLYHLRIDISAFSQANNGSADLPLTESALAGIEELLSFLDSRGKSAVARFVYDPGLNGSANKEPAREMIVQHITQLSAVLEQYHDTLTAIEVGLIGPWGEMHTSVMANEEVINALVETYLANTTELPILVRTPRMIYDYLGITINDIETYTIPAHTNAYRLGLYNDGYLGSDTDLGTYTNRTREAPWLANQTAHLPYGGEVVVPDSALHNIENCLEEMYQLHLSYLNIEWNNAVIEKWKNSTYTESAGSDTLYYGKTAFEYIENHMGYRFVLQNAILAYNDSLSDLAVKLSLQNVGFGNLNRAMKMTLLFQNGSREITAIDAGSFDGEKNISLNVPLGLQPGEYNVYLRLDKGNNNYALRFANDLWNEELQANRIGSIFG